MNQAQRYEHLVGLTEGKKLDSDYRAALLHFIQCTGAF